MEHTTASGFENLLKESSKSSKKNTAAELVATITVAAFVVVATVTAATFFYLSGLPKPQPVCEVETTQPQPNGFPITRLVCTR